MGTRRLWVWGWALLALSFVRSAFAQTETREPSQDAVPPQAPEPQRGPTSAPSIDEGLDVPPTLAPLSVPTDDVPSTTELPAPAPPAPVRFGGRGQWLMMGSSNGIAISNSTYTNSSASYFYAGGGLGIDYFVIDNVSVGVDAEASYRDSKGYGVTMLTETTSTQFAGGVRFGLNARLSESISWYPRLTLGLASSHTATKPISSSNGEALDPPTSSASVGPTINFYAPLLLQPVPHFVVGFGPRFQHDFAVTRGGPYDGSQSTWVSGEFSVGGWWGGATPEEQDSVRASAGAKPEKSTDPAFGDVGQLVLTTETDAWVGHRSYTLFKGAETALTFAPSVDYFISNSVSLGGEIAIGYSSGTGFDAAGRETETSSTSFGGGVRAGYNVRLAATASIWLRAAVGYGSHDVSVSSAQGTNQHTSTGGWVDLFAPFLLHPVSHFFVGAGPFVFHELDNRDQYERETNATRVGARLVLGGWFGSSGKLAW